MTNLQFGAAQTPTGDFVPELGRFNLPFDVAEAELVDDSKFQSSTTRRKLWDELLRLLGEFVAIEDANPNLFAGDSLVKMLWLSGSFVSTKVNPNNLDVTFFIDRDTRSKLAGLPGSGKLKKLMGSREHVLRNYSINSMFVNYTVVPHLFNEKKLSDAATEYFRDRGRWDDWFQRIRSSTGTNPTADSSEPRRGYVEVMLDV